MMVTENRGAPQDLLAAAPPPELYFRVANQLLGLVRILYMRGLLGAPGLRIALDVANYMGRIGMLSWRVRRRWRHR